MADAAETTPEKITLDRLEDQASWYSRKSKRAQRLYKTYQGDRNRSGGADSLLHGAVSSSTSNSVVGGLGVMITILEGILQLNQYQQIWTMYRATSEALTHEQYLYLAMAGPYAAEGVNPPVLLAERIETIMSQENTKWVSVQEQSGKSKDAKS